LHKKYVGKAEESANGSSKAVTTLSMAPLRSSLKM
jgi:hypothetical protein